MTTRAALRRWLPRTALGKRNSVENVTAANTLSVSESGKVVTNTGATASVTNTLPATPEKGTTYTFIVKVPFPLVVDPGAKYFFWNGVQATGSTGTLRSACPGDCLTVAYDGTQWVVTQQFGAWTESSTSIAQYAPIAAIMRDPSLGYFLYDDFLDLPTGKYTATQAGASGTFALDDAPGGVALAAAGATTVTVGINVQLNSTVGEIFTPAAGKHIWFEARIKIVAATAGPEFFLGLHEIDSTIIASSALTGSNMIGFSSITDNKVILSTCEKATAANTETFHTAVSGTYFNCGFIVNGVTSATPYLNGVAGTAHATANVPIVAMVPSLVCQADSTVNSVVHIDSWWFAQLR